MKTAYLSESGQAWIIRVVVWHGTTQETHYASTYAGAMRIVDERHRNAYSPTFFDRDGNQLADAGGCLIRVE